MVELVDVEASERRMCDYDNPEFVVVDVRLLLTNAFDVSEKEKINITITASTGNLTDEVRKWRLWAGYFDLSTCTLQYTITTVMHTSFD